MHNAVAHHPLTDTQPVPKQQPPPVGQFPPVLLFSVMPYHMGHPFGQLGSAVLAMSPPVFPGTPSLLSGRAAREAEKSLI